MPGLDQIIAEIQDRLAKLEDSDRSARLDNASIQATTMNVYDKDGNVVQIWGVHPDGVAATVDVGGAAPPKPSPPVLTAVVGGFRVAWDGTFADNNGAPKNLKGVDIHVEMQEDFVANDHTRDASIYRPGGGIAEFRSTTYENHYVRLVAVSASGLMSEPSDLVFVTPLQTGSADIAADSVNSLQLSAGAVIPSASGTGTTGNLIPDAGFADLPWRTRRVAEQSGTGWTIAAGSEATSVGQSGYYAQCAPSVVNSDGSGLSNESIWMLPPPGVVVNPNERFYVAVWVARTPDGVGRWAAQVVFLDPDGRELTASTESVSLWRNITDLPDASLGNYILIDSNITVPASAGALALRIVRKDDQAGAASGAGTLLVQRAELRSLLTRSDPNSNRVEVGPNGINAYDGQNRILASLDQQGTVTATALAVQGQFTIGGQDFNALVSGLPQGDVVRCTCPNPIATTGVLYLLDTGFTALPGRKYHVHVTESIARGGQMGFRIRYTLDGSAPTSGSPLLMYNSAMVSDTIGVDIAYVLPAQYTNPTQVRLYLEQISWGGVSGNLDSTNTSVSPPVISLSVADVGPTVSVSSSGSQRFIKTYNSTFSRGWAATGGQNYDSGGGMWQGRTGPSGDDYQFFGFNYNQILADIGGATIENVELFLNCAWANNADGAYIRMRSTGLGVPPGNGVYPPVSACRWNVKFAIGQGQWLPLGPAVGTELQNGTTKGFTLDARDVAANPADYGRWDGYTAATRPVLRITYRK